MSTVELKNMLKEKIDGLNEDYLLEELLSIIALESNNNEAVKIPDVHKKGLAVSINQMDTGKKTPHHQVMQELKDGLKG